jgi:hypothetical protein
MAETDGGGFIPPPFLSLSDTSDGIAKWRARSCVE